MFNFFKKSHNKTCHLIAPMEGEIIPIQDVPDQVFSEKMMGDGFAIKPTNGLVCSPCDGEVLQIFPTNHALVVHSIEGLDIIIHIGLDTVQLKGEGFTRLVEVGKHVKAGDPLLQMDLKVMEKYEKCIISPIVITNIECIESMKINYKNYKIKESIGKVIIKGE
ncbi:MAG: PTS glucose transporter subunit IIA [Firmicutes bacterium HGW-Firmicutes-1]|jgi:glucose-specific phosphotransferase system IIA component|nr:MAG: PTS glucose transporter subunit IIA [Firmicutes bacterium HGW-Firmicutes-1]